MIMSHNKHILDIVTFCYDSICYTGNYSPHHPYIPPGIVYGLSKGLSENMPLVLYDSNTYLGNQSQSYSSFYWLCHYATVSGFLYLGSSYFKNLFLSIQYGKSSNDEEVDGIDLRNDLYHERYFEKFDKLKQNEQNE